VTRVVLRDIVTDADREGLEQRVLVLAPTGRDARLLSMRTTET